MIQAVIFDLDGTLSNTLNSIAYFANKTLEQNGLPPIPTERYKALTGNGAKTLVERMLHENNAYSESLFEKVLLEYNRDYDNNFLYLTAPYDGILDMLRQLKSKDIKTAVISNKPHSTTIKVVTALFGDDLLDIARGGQEDIPLKPDPTSLNQVISSLSLDKSQCLYVGDTNTDMKTAHNAGVFSIGVTWGFRDRAELMAENADGIIDSPMELFKYL